MKVILNPDKEHVKSIKARLKENGNYCPCVIVKSPDTKCMCKEFREQIENNQEGMCHCGLWIATR